MLPPRDQWPTLIDSGDSSDRIAFRAPPSERFLRVLPAVPTSWTPPPPARATVPSIPIDTMPCAYDVAEEAEPHWVPEPPPRRASFAVVEHEEEDEVRDPFSDPRAAVTLPTPRTRAQNSRISRNVVLPWPAIVMLITVVSGVAFEHVLAGDTRQAIASVLTAARLAR